jgi:hypothetical protein
MWMRPVAAAAAVNGPGMCWGTVRKTGTGYFRTFHSARPLMANGGDGKEERESEKLGLKPLPKAAKDNWVTKMFPKAGKGIEGVQDSLTRTNDKVPQNRCPTPTPVHA